MITLSRVVYYGSQWEKKSGDLLDDHLIQGITLSGVSPYQGPTVEATFQVLLLFGLVMLAKHLAHTRAYIEINWH